MKIPSCAKGWSSVTTVQREMEFVYAVCGQRKKKEYNVDLKCILGFLENTRDIFVSA